MSVFSSPLKAPAVIYLLAALWAVHGLQWFIPGDLHHYGIMPRSVTEIWHIALAPLIHANLWHLMGNSVALLGLGLLVQTKKDAEFWELWAILTLLAGLGTWLFGSNAYHIDHHRCLFSTLDKSHCHRRGRPDFISQPLILRLRLSAAYFLGRSHVRIGEWGIYRLVECQGSSD